MQDKIWVIGESSGEQAGTGGAGKAEDHPEEGTGREQGRGTSGGSSPGRAFSLSVAFWGGGQLYNGQGRLGVLLVLLMLNFYGYAGVSFLYGSSITRLLGRIGLTPAHIFLVAWVAFVSGLVIWIGGCWQAYREAARRRPAAYVGAGSRVLPPLCSLLIPGWGQFLNGQPKKGLLFLFSAVVWFTALLSAGLIPHLWASFDPGPARHALDWIFTVSCLALPALFLIWIVGFFDALKVALDEVKRESWIERFSYFRNRTRVQGWKRTVLPQFKRVVVVFALLAVCSGLGYFFVPREFYVSTLRGVQASLAKRQMAVLPEIIGRVLEPPEKGSARQRGFAHG